jgi:hypothetical protein
MRTLLVILFVTTLPFITNIQAAPSVKIQTPELEIGLTPRSPQQMVSFYEARGFPKEMRDIIQKQCFITVDILNTSNKIIWLDLSNWTFSSAGKPIIREHRDAWKKRWQEMNMPLNKQSTFRWTLLPETLDYLPGEHEGGNIVLPFTDKPIFLIATFATGDDKQGETITITTDKLFCAENAK